MSVKSMQRVEASSAYADYGPLDAIVLAGTDTNFRRLIQGENTGAGEDEGPMTEAQAERLLESVEEGRPRVSIPGGRSERPW